MICKAQSSFHFSDAGLVGRCLFPLLIVGSFRSSSIDIPCSHGLNLKPVPLKSLRIALTPTKNVEAFYPLSQSSFNLDNPVIASSLLATFYTPALHPGHSLESGLEICLGKCPSLMTFLCVVKSICFVSTKTLLVAVHHCMLLSNSSTMFCLLEDAN